MAKVRDPGATPIAPQPANQQQQQQPVRTNTAQTKSTQAPTPGTGGMATAKTRDAFTAGSAPALAPDAKVNLRLVTEGENNPIELPDQFKVPLHKGIDALLGDASQFYSKHTLATWNAVARVSRGLNARFTARIADRLGDSPDAARIKNALYPADGGTDGGVWRDTKGPQFELFAGTHPAAAQILQQGYVGDCYLMAGLASMAATDPASVANLISGPNPSDGSYNVSFHQPIPELTFGGIAYKVVNRAGTWGLEDAAGNPVPSTVNFDPNLLSVNARGIAVYDAGGSEEQYLEFGVGPKITVKVPNRLLVDGEGNAVGANPSDVDGDGILEIGINVIEQGFMIFMEQVNKDISALVGATWKDANGVDRPYGLFGYDVDGSGKLEGYENIEGGLQDWVSEMLTGKETYWHGVDADVTTNTLFAQLSAANDGAVVLAGTPAGDDSTQVDGIFQGHVYSVLGTVEMGGEQYVILRNPYGMGEPISNPPHVYTGQGAADGSAAGNGDDGIFMMTIGAFQARFSTVSGERDANGQPAVGNAHTGGGAEVTQQGLSAVLAHYWRVCINSASGAPTIPSTTAGTDPTTDPAATVPGAGVFNVVHGDIKGMNERWADFLTRMDLKGYVDVNALVQWVLRESYLATTADLRFYAEKVKYFNEIKKNLRDVISKNRDFMSYLQTKAAEQGVILDPSNEKYDQAAATDFFMRCVEEKGSTAVAKLFAGIKELAHSQSVDQLVDNADSLSQQKFGVSIPSSISEMIRTAFASGTDADKKAALRQVALFFCYLGDGGMKDGKWGAGGYDDIHHTGGFGEDHGPDINNEAALLTDFEHYSTDSANQTARSNLATGDIDILTAAFGLQPGTLSGSSSTEDIVTAAFQPVNDKWKNAILHGEFKNTITINQEISNAGPNSEIAKQFLGGDAASYWYQSENSDFEEYMKHRGISTQIPPPGMTTKGELDTHIKKLESELNSVGDDAQLANVDLQNILQKQQQTLQLMSNVSKMLYDTAMAIIRKIGS